MVERDRRAGADVILDNMGAKYLGRNVDALATEGRLVVIGMQGGTKGELDLGALLRKRGAVIATTLRARPAEEKAAICASVVEHVWPLVADGTVRPIVHDHAAARREAGGAHELMEAGEPHRQDPAHRVVTGPPLGWRHDASSSPSRLGDQDRRDDERAPVVIVGPDGQPVGAVPGSRARCGTASRGRRRRRARRITDLVEQPAKVMRIGSMIRQLLEEVKAAPLDEASRNRLKEIHQASIKELEAGLAPELVEELERLTLPFTDDETPSEGELRIAQAQLVGWLEGLFHGIQTAIYAQQMAARAQFEQMRRGAAARRPDRPPEQPGQPDAPRQPAQGQPGDSGPGMYLLGHVAQLRPAARRHRTTSEAEQADQHQRGAGSGQPASSVPGSRVATGVNDPPPRASAGSASRPAPSSRDDLRATRSVAGPVPPQPAGDPGPLVRVGRGRRTCTRVSAVRPPRPHVGAVAVGLHRDRLGDVMSPL